MVADKTRMDFLQKIWSKHDLKMMMKAKGKKKTKVSHAIRDIVLNEYHRRCKEKHALAFFKWRARYKSQYMIEGHDILGYFLQKKEEFVDMNDQVFGNEPKV